MRWRDVSTEVVWRLHQASGCRLGAEVVRAFDAGLEPHLHATKTSAATRSVVVLGVARDGATKTYAEVALRDDEDARQAHEQLRLDDVVEGARQALRRADAALNAVKEGKPVPVRRDTGKAS
jgi:hypothetical protein